MKTIIVKLIFGEEVLQEDINDALLEICKEEHSSVGSAW